MATRFRWRNFPSMIGAVLTNSKSFAGSLPTETVSTGRLGSSARQLHLVAPHVDQGQFIFTGRGSGMIPTSATWPAAFVTVKLATRIWLGSNLLPARRQGELQLRQGIGSSAGTAGGILGRAAARLSRRRLAADDFPWRPDTLSRHRARNRPAMAATTNDRLTEVNRREIERRCNISL